MAFSITGDSKGIKYWIDCCEVSKEEFNIAELLICEADLKKCKEQVESLENSISYLRDQIIEDLKRKYTHKI